MGLLRLSLAFLIERARQDWRERRGHPQAGACGWHPESRRVGFVPSFSARGPAKGTPRVDALGLFRWCVVAEPTPSRRDYEGWTADG